MTRFMSRLNCKHNMYLLQLLQSQMNYQRAWIITHLLQTIKCFSIQQILQYKKHESLIVSPIESNVEAQTQIKSKKPSEKDKLLAKKRAY